MGDYTYLYLIYGGAIMSRNINGKGTIYQESPTKWRAEIQIGTTSQGKKKMKKFSASSQREVKRKLKEFIENQYPSAASLKKRTLNEYYKIWIKRKEKQLKPLSLQRLKSTYQTFIEPEIGYLQFSQIDTDDIQKLIDKYVSTKSYSSLKKIKDLINSIYQYDEGLPQNQRIASFNPCKNVILTKQMTKDKRTIKYFTDDEITKIKEEISRVSEKNGTLIYPYGLIYILIYNTGMRMGEALALDKSDINLKNKTLKINKNLVSVKSKPGESYTLKVQDSPKTASGNRTISLNKSAVDAIEGLYEIFPESEYLVLNNRGSRVAPQNAEKTFSQILKQCKIDSNKRGVHSLRHTFARKLFESGVDVKVVSNVLGHSSIRITYDTYIDVIQDYQAQIMNTIPEI